MQLSVMLKLKIRLNSTVKIMLKKIEHKITILQYKYLFLDEKKIKLTKIVKTINMKIKNNDKKNNNNKKTLQ